MTFNFQQEGKLKFNRFSKLGMWYILALSFIATVAIIGQFLIQRHLESQVNDSRIVNLAGTQRYKSQWVVKMSLLLYDDMEHRHFPDKIKTLEELLEQWKRGHEGLQHGDAGLNLPGKNSGKIVKMFSDLDPYFQKVYRSAYEIIGFKKGEYTDTARFHNAMRAILDNETIFLTKMDQIVYQYDSEAKYKVATLSKLEYFLLGLSIVVILLEILFVFRPTAVQVNKTVNQLIDSEKNAKKLSKEIGALYASLENSYEQLSQVNEPVENPRLFAKADRGGNITFISQMFADILGTSSAGVDKRICDLFPSSGLGDDWMDEMIDKVSDGKSWQGEIRFVGGKNEEVWTEVIINPVYSEDDLEELLILGSDITRRKYAEKNMMLKNRAAIEKKINQQKFRSVLILEGQEEERKRLAMDIHDGIGQMLTSLKFQIESINLAKGDDAQRKLGDIQQLCNHVIKEVRRVTFNLKPTVLGDYGITAALNVFIREVGKLTETIMTYHVTGDMSSRLPQQVENNIFRIVQEAINNALKYAGAKQIDVLFEQREGLIVITVKDDGKGFDEKLVKARSMNIDSGRGFFNMYERAEYINAQLEIKSAPGSGTIVSLSVPVHATSITEQPIED
jgi:two-component system, NarL family, sensor histidine kinase DegS